jgi:hypothetical protein
MNTGVRAQNRGVGAQRLPVLGVAFDLWPDREQGVRGGAA